MSRRSPRAWRPAASAAAGGGRRASSAAIRKRWTRPACRAPRSNRWPRISPTAWWRRCSGPPCSACRACSPTRSINTADSMIGHARPRHLHFGWAAARLDDLLNLVPARLSGVLVCAASWLAARRRSARRAGARCGAMRAQHRSPNAGWPEAAIAGALGLALAGPRRLSRRAGRRPLDGRRRPPARRRAGHPQALRLYRRAPAALQRGAAAIALIWLRD